MYSLPTLHHVRVLLARKFDMRSHLQTDEKWRDVTPTPDGMRDVVPGFSIDTQYHNCGVYFRHMKIMPRKLITVTPRCSLINLASIQIPVLFCIRSLLVGQILA